MAERKGDKEMKLKKTMLYAEIVQHLCGRNDRISRRVWEDEEGRLFVKVEGIWRELSMYQLNKSVYDVYI